MYEKIDITPIINSPDGELNLTSYTIHKITDDNYELIIEYSNDKQKVTLKAPIKNIVWDTKKLQFGKEIACPIPKSFYSKYEDTSKDNTIFTIYIEDKENKNNLIIKEDFIDIL